MPLDLLQFVQDILSTFRHFLLNNVDLLGGVGSSFAEGLLEKVVSLLKGLLAARGYVEDLRTTQLHGHEGGRLQI